VFNYDEGTDVYVEQQTPLPGATNQGLRVLRARADADSLRLTLEGLGGRSYALRARSARRLGETGGVKITEIEGQDAQLTVSFDGPQDDYIRREVVIRLLARK
jgi:hypothetical protein